MNRPPSRSEPTIYIVDDEEPVRKALRLLVKAEGLESRGFASAQEFLAAMDEIGPGCVLVDVCMPGMSGLELQETLNARELRIPVIVITGHADVPTAVRAMKGGACDFVEKPFDGEELLRRIHECLNNDRRQRHRTELRQQARDRIARLTPRERQVMDGLVQGKRNKTIADELFISFRTVELHRASIMEKLEAQSLSDIVRTALIADDG